MAKKGADASGNEVHGPRLLRLDLGSVVAVHPLGEKSITIGRGEENTIVLDDALVSRQHAIVRLDEGRAVVEDTHSHNGTRVNERKVSQRFLQPGDAVRVGHTILLYLADPPPRPVYGWVIVRHKDSEVTVSLSDRPVLIGRHEKADIQVHDQGQSEFSAAVVGSKTGADIIHLATQPAVKVRLKEGIENRSECVAVIFQRNVDRDQTASIHERFKEPAWDKAGVMPSTHGQGEPSLTLNRECSDKTLMDLLRKEAARLDAEPPPSPLAARDPASTQPAPPTRSVRRS